jgi:hypothetical protein
MKTSNKRWGLIWPLLFLIILIGCSAGITNYQLPYPTEGAKLTGFESGQEPYGFGGIEWETDLSTLRGLEHYRTDGSHGGIDFYFRKGETLKIGGEPFEKVQYGFWKGKFYVGMITAAGPARWDRLKRAIFNHYGEGTKPFRNREEFLWSGENVIMALRYDEESKTGLFYIRSDSLRKKMIEKRSQ